MHVSIKKDLLVKVLAHANRIIEKRQASPVFGCVLFEANNDYLKITATNMDMTIIDIIDFNPVNCIINEPGIYCISVNLLYEISKKFNNNSNIVLQSNTDRNEIQITNNKSNFSIHYIDSSAFPPLDLVNESNDYIEFQMRVDDLRNAIDVAKVAMSQDIIRTQLNGIYIHHNDQDDSLRFVATDLFRISCVSMKSPNNSNNIKPIIISKKTVAELLHMLSDINKNNIVNIKTNDKQIIMEASIDDNIKSIYISRIVNGSFPEYKTALEIKNDKVLVVNVKDFINAIDRVDTIVSDMSNSIQLNINNNKLTVNGISKELGSATEELDCKYYYKADNDMAINDIHELNNNNVKKNVENENIIEDDVLEEYDWNSEDSKEDLEINYDNENNSINGNNKGNNEENNMNSSDINFSNREDINVNKEFKICFNSKYLLELIKQISTKDVYIYLNTSVSPTLIKPDPNIVSSNLSLVSVIMPVEIVHS